MKYNCLVHANIIVIIIGAIIGFQILTASIIYIPTDYNSIQLGIDNSVENDTIIVQSGTYYENLTIVDKNLTIASNFLINGDLNYISQTIVDGAGFDVIYINGTNADLMSIVGITIQNAGSGSDGIKAYSEFRLINNIIQFCSDGIDYESGSGGLCSNNIFENNFDDGIDLDGRVNILIENNIIRDNSDDGIEIRLHDYQGPMLTYIIRSNQIYGNQEDGIQLIDGFDYSSREFYIDHNIIFNNVMAGLGCMSGMNTIENYEGAAIAEPIFLINNTIANNEFGVTGGSNLTAFNNIVTGSAGIAMKNVNGNSLASYNDFWSNNINFENCNVDSGSTLFLNPLLNEVYHLQIESPCIDTGNPDTSLDPDSTQVDIGAVYFHQTFGCTSEFAENYMPEANINDGSCLYAFEFGDINRDTVLDILDVIVMIEIILEYYTPEPIDEFFGDIYPDGNITIYDIVLLVNLILEQ